MDIDQTIIEGNILFVDDEENVLTSLVRSLKKHIIPPPHKALSAEEALAIIRNAAVDVMVTDVRMAKIDGIELISLARQIRPELECIVLTGFGRVDNAAKAMQQGAVDYLEKPCDKVDLLLSLKRSLERANIVKATYRRILSANEKCNTILKQSPQPIISLGADGKIVMINQVALKLFQYENEQVLGKSFHSLFHHTKPNGDTFPENECPFYLALTNGESLERIPGIFWRRDNSFFSGAFSCNPIIENGNIAGSVVAIEDQAELHQLKAMVLEYQERDGALGDHLPMGIAWIDALSRVIVDINSYGLRLLKMTKNQVVGRDSQDIFCIHKDEKCLAGITGKTVNQQKSEIRDITGRVISVMKSIAPVSISGRDFLLESFIDLTRQDQAESDLRSVYDTFHSIVSRTCDGIIVIDSEGIVQFVNTTALSLFGRQQEDMVGRLLGFPSVSGEVTELELINSKGKKIVAEMRVADTDWKGRKAFIASLQDISVRKKLESYALHNANHDPLTGLSNRNLLEDRFQQIVSLAKRYKQTVALLFIDLDGFKYVNDTFGHNAGDIVLIRIADRLRTMLRSSDTISRIGGDEFLIAMRNIKETKDLVKISKKIIEKIGLPIPLEDGDASVGCSIGISLYPQDGADLETLIKNADSAMYQVKESGKNGFAFFSKS